ncbi:hypothetical protein ACKLNR_008726 [Fusarium oxysporum f. sp. zingiberi]
MEKRLNEFKDYALDSDVFWFAFRFRVRDEAGDLNGHSTERLTAVIYRYKLELVVSNQSPSGVDKIVAEAADAVNICWHDDTNEG